MNMTHNGKIGRLPAGIQEQLNRRMQGGEQGGPLAAWLNSLPEVKAVMAAEFEGKPVWKQNLSQWRRHGHREWLCRQEALALGPALAAEGKALQEASGAPLTDQMADWVGVRYLLAVRKLAEMNGRGSAGLKVLREFCHDVVALRRGEHRSAWLKMEMERRERKLAKTRAGAIGAPACLPRNSSAPKARPHTSLGQTPQEPASQTPHGL